MGAAIAAVSVLAMPVIVNLYASVWGTGVIGGWVSTVTITGVVDTQIILILCGLVQFSRLIFLRFMILIIIMNLTMRYFVLHIAFTQL